jgi:hypothetical protein
MFLFNADVTDKDVCLLTNDKPLKMKVRSCGLLALAQDVCYQPLTFVIVLRVNEFGRNVLWKHELVNDTFKTSKICVKFNFKSNDPVI